jgi:hypothetical protein
MMVAKQSLGCLRARPARADRGCTDPEPAADRGRIEDIDARESLCANSVHGALAFQFLLVEKFILDLVLDVGKPILGLASIGFQERNFSLQLVGSVFRRP